MTKILFWNIEKFTLEKFSKHETYARQYFQDVLEIAQPDVVTIQEVLFPGDLRLGEIIEIAPQLVNFKGILDSVCKCPEPHEWRIIPPAAADNHAKAGENRECYSVFFRPDKLKFFGPKIYKDGAVEGGYPPDKGGYPPDKGGSNEYSDFWKKMSGLDGKYPKGSPAGDLVFPAPDKKTSPERGTKRKTTIRRPWRVRFTRVDKQDPNQLEVFDLVTAHFTNEYALETGRALADYLDLEIKSIGYPIILGGDTNMMPYDTWFEEDGMEIEFWKSNRVIPDVPGGINVNKEDPNNNQVRIFRKRKNGDRLDGGENITIPSDGGEPYIPGSGSRRDPVRVPWRYTTIRTVEELSKNPYNKGPQDEDNVDIYRLNAIDHVWVFPKANFDATATIIDLLYPYPKEYEDKVFGNGMKYYIAENKKMDSFRRDFEKIRNVSDHLPLLVEVKPKVEQQ